MRGASCRANRISDRSIRRSLQSRVTTRSSSPRCAQFRGAQSRSRTRWSSTQAREPGSSSSSTSIRRSHLGEDPRLNRGSKRSRRENIGARRARIRSRRHAADKWRKNPTRSAAVARPRRLVALLHEVRELHRWICEAPRPQRTRDIPRRTHKAQPPHARALHPAISTRSLPPELQRARGERPRGPPLATWLHAQNDPRLAICGMDA